MIFLCLLIVRSQDESDSLIDFLPIATYEDNTQIVFVHEVEAMKKMISSKLKFSNMIILLMLLYAIYVVYALFKVFISAVSKLFI
jgi:hypothetical protein